MSTVSEESIRAAAAGAAAILRKRGWCQGVFVDHQKRVDLATALSNGAGDVASDIPEAGRLIGAIAGRLWRLVGCPLTGWNDAPGRTADEVISVLERVASGEGAP